MSDKALFRTTDGTLTTTTTSESFKTKERSLSVHSTWDVTTPSAKTTVPGTLEVQTLTFPSASTGADGDYVVLEDVTGAKWALALSKSAADVKLLTFLAKASCVAGDFMMFYDTDGVQWGISVNKSGTDVAPTAAGWVALAAAKKAHVDISSATTAAQVAALFETAMNALTGFTAKFTTDDTAADGTMLLTSDAIGAVSATTSHKKDAGTGASAGVGTSISGASSVVGYTTAAPTGAIWTAIAEANKGSVDLTGLTDAASVAAASELILDALVGFTDVIATDDTAADGTMLITQAEPGAAVNPVVKNATDEGAGTISGVQSTPGVGGVNLTTNAVYSAAHTLATGLLVRLTTGTTLPAGLALATDYFIISVNANEVKFASSLANAQAGTAVNITDRGTGTHTITAEALAASTKLQKSNDNVNWVDVHDDEVLGGNNSQTITADGAVFWNIPDATWNYVRQVLTLTGGQLTLSTLAVGK